MSGKREPSMRNLAKANEILHRQRRIAREARQRRIAQLVADGESNERVAAILGIHVRTVTWERQVLGISGPGCNVRFTDEQKEFIQYLLEDGCPYREVARTVGVGVKSIRLRWPGYGTGPGNPLGTYYSGIAAQLGLGTKALEGAGR